MKLFLKCKTKLKLINFYVVGRRGLQEGPRRYPQGPVPRQEGQQGRKAEEVDRQEADPRGEEGEGQDRKGRILGPNRRSEGINIWRLLFPIIMQTKPPLSKYIR